MDQHQPSRRTLHLNIRVPFCRFGLHSGDAAAELEGELADTSVRSSFGPALHALVVAAVQALEKLSAATTARAKSRRVSIPRAWADGHPGAYAQLQTALFPLRVDTATSANFATFWEGEIPADAATMTDTGLPEDVIKAWQERAARAKMS